MKTFPLISAFFLITAFSSCKDKEETKTSRGNTFPAIEVTEAETINPAPPVAVESPGEDQRLPGVQFQGQLTVEQLPSDFTATVSAVSKFSSTTTDFMTNIGISWSFDEDKIEEGLVQVNPAFTPEAGQKLFTLPNDDFWIAG